MRPGSHYIPVWPHPAPQAAPWDEGGSDGPLAQLMAIPAWGLGDRGHCPPRVLADCSKSRDSLGQINAKKGFGGGDENLYPVASPATKTPHHFFYWIRPLEGLECLLHLSPPIKVKLSQGRLGGGGSQMQAKPPVSPPQNPSDAGSYPISDNLGQISLTGDPKLGQGIMGHPPAT